MQRIIALLLCSLVLGIAPGAAMSQVFPSKPVRFVVGSAAGSTPDAFARWVAQKMTESWGTQVIVDNRPGVSGTLAADHVAKAPADGYTLLFSESSSWGINPHPLMFTAGKAGPAIATGNTVIMKPPHQAPLSAYRFAELVDGILPPGVLNIVTCGTQGAEALVAHPLVPRLSLIGSVPTGRAISRSAADQLKHVTLELGGKNACVIYPDANIERAARAAVDGMNFTWCGQSCGSTSRLFVHESVYDAVMERVLERMRHYRPGIPTDRETTMGAIVSQQQLDKVLSYIAVGRSEGATVAYGGRRPEDPMLAGGCFVEPTVFTGVTQSMRIASEEIFGPVLSVIKWSDEEQMFSEVNRVEYGLTSSIWTTNLATAHRAAARIEAGYIWVNRASTHFIGASFGGYKQSGIGREESIEELLSFTQNKNINITLTEVVDSQYVRNLFDATRGAADHWFH